MNTASEQLATAIIEKLIQEKLITVQASKKFAAKLAEGKATAEDWRFLIEGGQEKATK